MLKHVIRLLGLLALLGSAGCAVRNVRWTTPAPASDARWHTYTMDTAGYCPCGTCCNWRRSWWVGRPVVAAGPNKGRPKAIGMTASGVRARPGTVTADGKLFPFGTRVYVPGYGYGIVEDRGTATQGYSLDLFFTTHKQALAWGRRRLQVRVLIPERETRR